MKPSNVPTPRQPKDRRPSDLRDQAHGGSEPATPSILHAQWLAGHAAARSQQAAALARLYAKELIRMAVDDAMLDSAGCGDHSPEGLARSAELDISMWRRRRPGRLPKTSRTPSS